VPSALGTRVLLALAAGLVLAPCVVAATGAARADLVVRVADAPDPASLTPGVRYRVSVTNRGPATAARVTVRLRTSVPTAMIEIPNGCFADDKGVGCRRAQLLPRRTWTVTFGVVPCAPETIVATATSAAGTADPRPRNNTAHEQTTFLPGRPPPPPPDGSGCPN
jgi:uncharacterized repeat protein (TIGR01451 family)